MCAEYKGYSEPADVVTLGDAYRILNLQPGDDEDDLSVAWRAATLEWHPDAGGDTDVFSAMNKAQQAIAEAIEYGSVTSPTLPFDASVEPSLVPSVGEAEWDIDEADERMDEGPADEGPDFGGVDLDQDLIDIVEDLLRERYTEEQLKNRYGPYATYENMAEVLAMLILQGSITLGDVNKIVGGDTRFDRGREGMSDSRFTRGRDTADDNFTRRGRGGDDRFR